MSPSLEEQAHTTDLKLGRHSTYWLGGSPCAGKSFVAEWVDGRRSIEELTALAAAHFGLRS
jgi:hypothetical protein